MQWLRYVRPVLQLPRGHRLAQQGTQERVRRAIAWRCLQQRNGIRDALRLCCRGRLTSLSPICVPVSQKLYQVSIVDDLGGDICNCVQRIVSSRLVLSRQLCMLLLVPSSRSRLH
eukprot:COSAG01_NODE_3881_length_5591_cov_101.856154_2_plen_115_part_00